MRGRGARTGHQAGLVDGCERVRLREVDDVGDRHGRGWHGHLELDRGTGQHGDAGSGILPKDGARLELVGLDRIGAHDEAVVLGSPLCLLQAQPLEVRRVDARLGRRAGAPAQGGAGDGRRRERRVHDSARVEGTEEDEDDGEGDDEGTDEDAAHEEDGRAFVGWLAVDVLRRRREGRELRRGAGSRSQGREGGLGGVGIGRDRRGRPGRRGHRACGRSDGLLERQGGLPIRARPIERGRLGRLVTRRLRFDLRVLRVVLGSSSARASSSAG